MTSTFSHRARQKARKRAPAKRPARLWVEPLETRVVPSLTSGIFEIDGNAIDNTPGTGTGVLPAKTPAPDDWANIYRSLGGTGAGSSLTPPTKASDGVGAFDSAVARSFVSDPAATDNSFFTGGGSKDTNDINQWLHTTNDVSPDKNDLTDAYAAGYIDPANNHGYVYFGSDRFDTSGSAQMGFWFFKNEVDVGPNGTFTTSGGGLATHVAGTVNFTTHKVVTAGDFLVLTDFTQGGTVPSVKVYMWVGGNNGDSNDALLGTTFTGYKKNGPIQLLFDSAASGTTDVNGDGISDITAQVNTSAVTASNVPWAYTDKNGSHGFAANAFFEGGVDLTSLGLGSGCISSFLAESRSSGSATTAQLKDFALGQFDFCFVEVQGGTGTSKPTDTATYTITMTNNGAATLYLKDVTDVTGAGAGNTTLGNIVLNGVVQTAPAGETYNVPAGALDGLAPGETQTITVTRLTTAADLAHDPIVTKTNVVFNTKADFTGDAVTHDPAVNTVDLFNPAVLITKSADKTAAKVGDVITYTFTITNKTDGDTTTAALDGTAPNLDLATISDSLLGDLSSQATAAGADHLTMNEADSFTVTHTVTAADFANFSNGPLTNKVDVLYHPTGFPNDIKSSASNSVDLVDAYITITPATATNEVNKNHTFTATVNKVINGTASAANNASATITLTASNGATPSPAGPFSGSTNASGQFAATFTSATAGQVAGHASATLTVEGVSLTVATDGATTVTGNTNSGDAQKAFVNANIAITPSPVTNEVGHAHTFTVTVKQDRGDGNGLVAAPDGTTVLLTLTSTLGAAGYFTNAGGDNLGTSLTVTVSGGTATFLVNSGSTGHVSIDGLTTVSVDPDGAGGFPAQSVTRETGDGLSGDSADAVKVFVDANIALSPLTAENQVLQNHTVTATVKEDLGDGNGVVVAAANVPVVFTVNPGTATLIYTDANADGDNNPLTATTDANGKATLTFTSSTPGTVTVNASTTFQVDSTGVTVTRDTDPNTPATAGPGGTGPAQKMFLGFPDLHITKEADLDTNQSGSGSVGAQITAPIPQGDTFFYVLHVHNDGNAAAHNVKVNDDLDNRLTIVGGTVQVTVNGLTTTVTPTQDPSDPTDSNHIIIAVGTLARSGQPGDSADIVIRVDTGVPNTDCLYTTNTASVATTDPETPAALHGGTPGESDNTSNTVVVITTETFQTITFDPDGPGPLAPITGAAVFDQAPGNALALAGVLPPGTQGDVQVVFQSTLSALLDGDGNNISVPGLGRTFQLLTEVRFWEHESQLSSTVLDFSPPTAHDNATQSSVQFIYHPIGTALNNRTGAGFAFSAANGDKVILTGTVANSSIDGVGKFSIDALGNLVKVKLDQAAGSTNTQQSLKFSGSTDLSVNVTSTDSGWFPDTHEAVQLLSLSTENVTPFKQVGANTGGYFNGVLPNLGAVNGLSGPDAEFQSDINTSFIALCVPFDEAGNPVLGLQAASVGGGATGALTAQQLQPITAEAIARWAATGLGPQGASALQHVAVHITDLPGAYLGLVADGQIWIDQDAAGWGWSLGSSAAPNRMDLATVLDHEFGHVLGFEHTAASGLMDASLAPGVQLTPAAPSNLVPAPARGVDAVRGDGAGTGATMVPDSHRVALTGQAAPRSEGVTAPVADVAFEVTLRSSGTVAPLANVAVDWSGVSVGQAAGVLSGAAAVPAVVSPWAITASPTDLVLPAPTVRDNESTVPALPYDEDQGAVPGGSPVPAGKSDPGTEADAEAAALRRQACDACFADRAVPAAEDGVELSGGRVVAAAVLLAGLGASWGAQRPEEKSRRGWLR
jgi:uncharacterized repeat protein (TIGR01451 family)